MKKLYSLVFILFLTPTCLYAQNGWNQIYNFENLNVFSITFKDSLTGFATSFASKIYKTTNGGKSWNEINIQQLNKPINKLNVVNNNFIFGIGDAGTVARSFDGGDLWKVDNIGDSSLSSCCGTSNGNLFICSFSGIIYKSTDFGESWNKKYIDSSGASFYNITFPDNNTGFVTDGRLNKTYKTTDGGENWFPISNAINGQINAIKFLDKSTGFVTGWDDTGEGQIKKTTDGGNSWTLIKSGANLLVNNIVTAGKNFVWINGWDRIFFSNDAGETWIEQTSISVYSRLTDISSVDSSTCFALGGGPNVLFKSTTSGLSAPILDFPRNDSKELALTFNLLWRNRDNSKLFTIELSADSLFRNLILDTTITDTLQKISIPSINTKYFWRVQNNFKNINGPWSYSFSFTTTKGSPILISPANNSIDIPIPTLFSWKDISLKADSYQLEISVDSLFNNLVYNNSSIINDSSIINQLSDSTLYFWRVRADINGEYGAWSNICSFRTTAKTPHLIYPDNNTFNLPAKILFKWSQTFQTNYYILQVSKDSLFKSNITINNESTNNFEDVTLNLNTEYYWRVGAQNYNSIIYWSKFWEFKTGNKINAPLFPLYIGNKWYYQVGSTRDKFYYGMRKEITDTLSNGFREITDTFYYKDSVTSAKEYWDYTNGKLYVNTKPDINSAYKCYDVSIIQDTCTNSIIIECWNLISYKIFNVYYTAQQYRNTFFSHGSGSSIIFITIPNIGIVKTKDIYGPMYDSNTDSTYLIGANINGKLLGDTTFFNFYRISIPISPANNSTESPSVELKWRKAFDANSYRVQVSTDSTFNNLIFDYSGLKDTSKTITQLDYGTKYYWRIETSSNDGNKYKSQVFRFNTIDSSLISLPKYPLNNSTGMPNIVELKWSFVIGTINYRLQISNDSAFAYVIKDVKALSQIDTSYTVSFLNYGVKYYWRIETYNSYSSSFGYWSNAYCFTTVNLNSIGQPKFPQNNSTGLSTKLELKWNSVSGSKYELQLSSDSTFTNIIKNISNLADTSYTLDSLNYNSKYFWRLKTKTSLGNEYVSEIWNFTTAGLPKEFTLYQNYPNPFNPITKIKYDLPNQAHVTLKIYDILGREVTTLVNDSKPAGRYEVEFNGIKFASGIYLYKLQAGNYTSVKKMILVK